MPVKRPKRFSEKRPAEIAAWCIALLESSPNQARQLVLPLMRLDYTKLDSATGRLVEESVRYAMTGLPRKVAPASLGPLPLTQPR